MRLILLALLGTGISASAADLRLGVPTTISFSTVQILQNGAPGNNGAYPNTPFLWRCNINGYCQMVGQNLSNGANASTDHVLNNDLGADTSYYINIGINSSKFSQAGFSSQPSSAGYITTSDSDLFIWSDINGGLNKAANGKIVFGSSNPTTGNISGYLLVATNTFPGAWVFLGSATFTNINGLLVTTSVTASAFFGNGSGLTNVSVSNLSGGAIGNVPYQSGAGATAFLPTIGSGGLIVGSGAGNIPSTGTITGSGSISVTVLGNSSLVVSTSGTSIAMTNLPNTFSSTQTILGVTDGTTSGPATYIGEMISTTPITTITPPASGAVTSIATTTLTAGVWDVTGNCAEDLGATTAQTNIECGISKTANVFDVTTGDSVEDISGAGTVNQSDYLFVGIRRISVTGAAIGVFLVGQLTYSVLGGATYNSARSILQARRVR